MAQVVIISSYLLMLFTLSVFNQQKTLYLSQVILTTLGISHVARQGSSQVKVNLGRPVLGDGSAMLAGRQVTLMESDRDGNDSDEDCSN